RRLSSPHLFPYTTLFRSLWNGFTFLAGMIGNPGKVCIGIDNFSEYGGPRDAFNSRFDRYKSQKHHFYDMDYAEYFSRLDKGLIRSEEHTSELQSPDHLVC